jgi:hypothetical protein
VALVKAGADVHCKTNDGYGPRGCNLLSFVCQSAERTVRPLGLELQAWLLWLCSQTAMHWASKQGHMETMTALIKAGADVHCKDKDGYGFSTPHARVVCSQQCRGGRSVHSGRIGRSACLAVQQYGAALGVVGRQDGDGDGAGQGGRGRALQDQRRVRLSGCILMWMLYYSAGRTVRPLGADRQECMFGCAARLRCTGRRATATQRRRWD